MDSLKNFITNNRSNSFFLYFPTQLPHGPVSIPKVHPNFANRNDLTQIEKEYASMVKLLDENVGEIVKHLKSLNLYENTIIIFTSDNGHEIYYSQEGRTLKPYKNMKAGIPFDNITDKYYSSLSGDVFNGNNGRAGMKRSNLEGGIEVPLIYHWPKKIKPGQISDRLVTNYDFAATLADIVGTTRPIQTDGISYYETLLDSENKENEHPFIVFSSFEGPTLISNDGWKLRSVIEHDIFELYYLPIDYKEEFNLADQNQEKVKELKSLLLKACENDFENGLWKNTKLQSIVLKNEKQIRK